VRWVVSCPQAQPQTLQISLPTRMAWLKTISYNFQVHQELAYQRVDLQL
jgi:hypothetical protein